MEIDEEEATKKQAACRGYVVALCDTLEHFACGGNGEQR